MSVFFCILRQHKKLPFVLVFERNSALPLRDQIKILYFSHSRIRSAANRLGQKVYLLLNCCEALFVVLNRSKSQ